MSWKDNRRRKRVWYGYYYDVCRDVRLLIQQAQSSGVPIAAEALVKIVYDMNERRRLHKKRRVATSALESLVLAVKDSGIEKVLLMPKLWPDGRSNVVGKITPDKEPGSLRPGDMLLSDSVSDVVGIAASDIADRIGF